MKRKRVKILRPVHAAVMGQDDAGEWVGVTCGELYPADGEKTFSEFKADYAEALVGAGLAEPYTGPGVTELELDDDFGEEVVGWINECLAEGVDSFNTWDESQSYRIARGMFLDAFCRHTGRA